MKRFLYSVLFTCVSVITLNSCSKDTDLYDSDADQAAKVKQNVLNIFGVTFSPDQDWHTTVSKEITVLTNASVKKVQVLAKVANENVSTEEVEYIMTVLNEAEVQGQASVSLKYNAPVENKGIFVAAYTDNDYKVTKVSGDVVDVVNAPSAARRRNVLSTDYPLPVGTFTIGVIEDSYASQEGWVPGEKLYALSDYEAQKMASADYDENFKEVFESLVFSHFPNGRNYNNLPEVKKSGYYNDKIYPITTGDKPIIVTPIYKRDCATRYGNEVYNSDLYYYYFDEKVLTADMDTVAFLQSLPKYKAIPFNICFDVNEDGVIGKHGSFALMYFGDATPEIGTKGSFSFPKGYKIGFMVRAKTEYEKPKKQGELYGDGRLNNAINGSKKHNFKSSNLGTNGPRAAWLTVNKRMLLCWESGTDADFNDVILDVEGGIEPFNNPPKPKKQVYTYCFEDREIGDYDMNDVVIKAYRENDTTVVYSIVACGANDELYIRNINCGVIQDNAEIHSLFGTTPVQLVNTNPKAKFTSPISAVKKVAKSFTFDDESTVPYIYDATTGKEIHLSKKGQDPHGIMVPCDFKYPQERVCVKKAYEDFNKWGVNPITSTEWYAKPVESLVCTE